ncbi:MAG: hypothetical protein HY301_12000 [Verrucomicrobia bacterium]|nr:hypothetical protein [Verrucomicrobiota bacterium]
MTLSVLAFAIASLRAASLPDLSSVPKDLHTPPMVAAAPAPGKRVKQAAPGWERTAVYHSLYLPVNWQPGKKFPVLFEFAGNGGYSNQFGDVSAGVPEGSSLGYGISGGSNFIWVCLPFVAVTNGQKKIATKWWGDVDETIRYCTNAVRSVCENFGGDPNALLLCGFSRGAIACNFIGLHDERIAPLWRAFIAHSHYDGVKTNWGYAGADRASALARLQRLEGRPQFISHEGTVAPTREYLATTGVRAPFTFVPLPFRNHSDEWVLRDLPERRQLRAWLDALLAR